MRVQRRRSAATPAKANPSNVAVAPPSGTDGVAFEDVVDENRNTVFVSSAEKLHEAPVGSNPAGPKRVPFPWRTIPFAARVILVIVARLNMKPSKTHRGAIGPVKLTKSL